VLGRIQHLAPAFHPVLAGPRFFTSGALQIDFEKRSCRVGSRTTKLTLKEAELLQYLVLRAGKVISRRELLAAVWGPDTVSHSNYLHVLVTKLRKKIEPDPSRPIYILTSPWFGYGFSLSEP
jgi:two-component system KDP operon response regulator KdpE